MTFIKHLNTMFDGKYKCCEEKQVEISIESGG
jgi:hypothetical protein